MRYARRIIIIICCYLFASLLLSGIITNDGPASAAQNSDSEIVQLMEKAATSFQNQEFIVSYELYQRVLLLEPMHQTAREKIYDIAEIYQKLVTVARQEEDEEKAQLLHTQYRQIIRYLLNILTTQLEKSIKSYTHLKDEQQQTAEPPTALMTTLENIIHILEDLQKIYTQFPRDNEKTKQMVERIGKNIVKYQKELAQYTHQD